MPFIQWDVTSLTAGREGKDEAYGFYFGTKNGVAGYWVRIPDNAPPIGDITLAGVVGSDPVGLSFVVCIPVYLFRGTRPGRLQASRRAADGSISAPLLPVLQWRLVCTKSPSVCSIAA